MLQYFLNPFYVEEVMISSLLIFYWVKINWKENPKDPICMGRKMICTNDSINIQILQKLGCYKPTPLKMNLALEIWVGQQKVVGDPA